MSPVLAWVGLFFLFRNTFLMWPLQDIAVLSAVNATFHLSENYSRGRFSSL